MGVETIAARGARPVLTAGLEFVARLFGVGGRATAPTARALAPAIGTVGPVAARRAALLAGGRQILPFAGAGVAGAIIGGTLLDDVGPDLAAQLREAGIEPSQFRRRRPKGPEIVVDPVTGARFRRIKKRRARGISAVELRGFRRVTDLLVDVGLAPRKIPTAGNKKRRR